MDSALAFYADGPGSIPAVSKSKTKRNIQMVFLPLGIWW